MRNIRLVLEYDGTGFAGWQRQADARTVQAEVENALRQLTQLQTGVIGAGRTDAGVHARGQVANFRTESGLQMYEFQNGLNALLPEDVVVLAAEEVPLEFHARYSARAREYSYAITRRPTALLRNRAWFVKYDLTLDAMRWAAASIIGTHSFEAFCKANADVEHHRCTVEAASWSADDHSLRFEIRADRFLHGMVRALVGTMVDVGRGYTPLDRFVKLLESTERSAAGMSAPAAGLTLEHVTY